MDKIQARFLGIVSRHIPHFAEFNERRKGKNAQNLFDFGRLVTNASSTFSNVGFLEKLERV